MKNNRVRADITYGAWMLSAVVESSPLAIITLDMDGKIQLWNPAAEAMLGYSAETVIGKTHPIMKPVKQDEMCALFKLVLQGSAFSGVNIKRKRKDGSPIDISLAMAPLYDEENAICGVIQVLSDLTEQKREAEYKRLLEDRVLESQKMEAVGRMAAGITHDFNNLLTVILGNLDMILNELDANHPLFPMIKEIEQASKSAAELTSRMLVFSRRKSVATTVVSLPGLVMELRKILARMLGETINLEISAPLGSGNILADHGQMEQIVMNLVSNAKTAMPDGGNLYIEVADDEIGLDFCKIHPNVLPGSYVRLTVRDSGTGISRDLLKRLFEPFVTSNPTGAHAGLGLSIVWAIVKAHQGVVDVESDLGKGTSFHIRFPRANETGDLVAADNEHVAKGTETILVVDDDSDLLQTVALSLTRLGYTVLQAQGGAEALKMAQKHAGGIHLVFSDVVMPVLAGPDLIKHLRDLKPDLPVIFTSGYSDHALLTRCKEIQNALFLHKPYTVQQVAGMIRNAFEQPV